MSQLRRHSSGPISKRTARVCLAALTICSLLLTASVYPLPVKRSTLSPPLSHNIESLAGSTASMLQTSPAGEAVGITSAGAAVDARPGEAAAASIPSPAGDQPRLTGAFSRDLALPDGRRLVAVSPTPLNYQAGDGTWRPIDPTFQVAAGGFVNRANLLQISAGQRTAGGRFPGRRSASSRHRPRGPPRH